MKTLNEVIKAIENCLNPADKLDNCREQCPYIHCCDQMSIHVKKDALHYLKEYQKVDSNYWSEKAISELNNIADAYFLRAYREDKDELTALLAYRKEQNENAPLTWDELKLMEGFPVWVEGSHGPALSYKGWALISFDRQGDDMKCQLYNSSEFWIGEEDYGTDWQAYRKERK